MIGDALVTVIDPQRHCRLWMKGPEKWRQFVNLFVQHPGIARGLLLVNLGWECGSLKNKDLSNELHRRVSRHPTLRISTITIGRATSHSVPWFWLARCDLLSRLVVPGSVTCEFL